MITEEMKWTRILFNLIQLILLAILKFWICLFLTIHYPVSKDSHDEFSRLEGVKDALDQPGVRRQGDVALETDVGALGLGGNVDRHVLSLEV